jgi:hypothetical protein
METCGILTKNQLQSIVYECYIPSSELSRIYSRSSGIGQGPMAVSYELGDDSSDYKIAPTSRP